MKLRIIKLNFIVPEQVPEHQHAAVHTSYT